VPPWNSLNVIATPGPSAALVGHTKVDGGEYVIPQPSSPGEKVPLVMPSTG
jgi:hypothetical protein